MVEGNGEVVAQTGGAFYVATLSPQNSTLNLDGVTEY
jgi:hypothetical protein